MSRTTFLSVISFAISLATAQLILPDTPIPNSLVPRQADSGTGSTYLNSVCLPAVTSGPIPPCTSVSTIESACLPNGTSSLAYKASAECLCNAPSSFFADWLGCRQCLVAHGALSAQDYNRAASVIALVSGTLCAAASSPTAEFAQVYKAVDQGFTSVVQGDSVSTDSFPSQTAVSLYYTNTGKQGPGVVTGSAVAATSSATAAGGAGTTTTAAGGDSTGTTTADGGNAPTLTAGGNTAGTTPKSSEAQATLMPVGVAAILGGLAALI